VPTARTGGKDQHVIYLDFASGCGERGDSVNTNATTAATDELSGGSSSHGQTVGGGATARTRRHHRSDKGIWYLDHHPVPSKELSLPDFNITKHFGDDAEQYLERLAQHPPKQRVPYYIGPLSGSFATELQSCFPSGPEVGKLGVIPGVSTLWAHIGDEASGTSFHCEDANLRSYNLTLIGWKIWVLIKPEHTTNFENLVQRLTCCDNTCEQFVRHTSIVIQPSRLREENIEFDIICAGPGEMVLTQPRQYHAVINRTASFAIATNFALPNEDPIPEGIYMCPSDGFYRLEHKGIRRLPSKRKHDGEGEAPVQIKKPNLTKGFGTSIVKDLVRQTTSRDAILRFMTLVQEWRKADADFCGQLMRVSEYDLPRRLAALEQLRASSQRKSHLFSFLEILTGTLLFRSLPRQLSKITSGAIGKLIEVRGLQDTRQNRKSVRSSIHSYSKWNELCGPRQEYDGILCFVPAVFKECPRAHVINLRKEDVAQFWSMLEDVVHLHRLCEAGKAFQMAIWGSAKLQKRPFEALSYEALDRLGRAALLDLL
jgi:hypothetical protein